MLPPKAKAKAVEKAKENLKLESVIFSIADPSQAKYESTTPARAMTVTSILNIRSHPMD